jgi:hypothetical protein
MLSWPLIKFPPVNLFSVPVQAKVCKHTHWAVYYSFRKKVCVDCALERPFDSVAPVHQR